MGSTCTYAPRSTKCEKANDVDLSFPRKRKFPSRNSCTNLPMKCELCVNSDTYIWKYNMARHIALVHDGQNGSQRGGSLALRLCTLWKRLRSTSSGRRGQQAQSRSCCCCCFGHQRASCCSCCGCCCCCCGQSAAARGKPRYLKLRGALAQRRLRIRCSVSKLVLTAVVIGVKLVAWFGFNVSMYLDVYTSWCTTSTS